MERWEDDGRGLVWWIRTISTCDPVLSHKEEKSDKIMIVEFMQTQECATLSDTFPIFKILCLYYELASR